MEAEVLLLDRDIARLRWVDQIHQGRIMTLASNRGSIERALAEADLVIGAVLVAAGEPPTVITEEMVAGHEARRGHRRRGGRPGRMRRDDARDNPRGPHLVVHGVLHYAVGNMPAAVPHTSTYALTNATFPYLIELVEHGVDAAVVADPVLAAGQHRAWGRYQRGSGRGPRPRLRRPDKTSVGLTRNP